MYEITLAYMRHNVDGVEFKAGSTEEHDRLVASWCIIYDEELLKIGRARFPRSRVLLTHETDLDIIIDHDGVGEELHEASEIHTEAEQAANRRLADVRESTTGD